MDNKPVSVTEKVIGDTLYIIESTVSDTAKETAYDKLKRMILNDTASLETKKASQPKLLDFFTVVREYRVPLEDCRKGGKHEHNQTVFRCEGR